MVSPRRYEQTIGISTQWDRTPTRTAIGVRMPLKDVQGQFRNWTDEGPEAWAQQDIPPERLVSPSSLESTTSYNMEAW